MVLQSNSFSGTPAPDEHLGVVCDGCSGKIRGVRHRCNFCPNYDLCSQCKQKGIHNHHIMHELNPYPHQSNFPPVPSPNQYPLPNQSPHQYPMTPNQYPHPTNQYPPQYNYYPSPQNPYPSYPAQNQQYPSYPGQNPPTPNYSVPNQYPFSPSPYPQSDPYPQFPSQTSQYPSQYPQTQTSPQSVTSSSTQVLGSEPPQTAISVQNSTTSQVPQTTQAPILTQSSVQPSQTTPQTQGLPVTTVQSSLPVQGPPVTTMQSLPPVQGPPVTTMQSLPPVQGPPVTTMQSLPPVQGPPVTTMQSLPPVQGPPVTTVQSSQPVQDQFPTSDPSLSPLHWYPNRPPHHIRSHMPMGNSFPRGPHFPRGRHHRRPHHPQSTWAAHPGPDVAPLDLSSIGTILNAMNPNGVQSFLQQFGLTGNASVTSNPGVQTPAAPTAPTPVPPTPGTLSTFKWSPAQQGIPSKRQPLQSSDQEYQEVIQKMKGHGGDAWTSKVTLISRIENYTMFNVYKSCKEEMDREYGAGFQNERMLWHGTSADVLDNIYRGGFNRSYCGKNATAFGKGVYFATSFAYSASNTYSPPDSKGQKYIFLCRVLTGHFAQGQPGLNEPPMRTSELRYDSVVDNVNNPKMFVIFKDMQAYPEYVITLKA